MAPWESEPPPSVDARGAGEPPADQAANPASRLVGRTIAHKFTVESILGEGGMGTVYRARHLALGQSVALKVMHAPLSRDELFVQRFEREAKAAFRLNHPNSVRILDFGRDDDGLLYIAMELLHGRDLNAVIEKELPLDPRRIANLLRQALAAIGAAHALGIVHRDLKPANILVLRETGDEGEPIDVVKVCDFGIAKLVDPKRTAERREKAETGGLVIGTPEYMAPEQGRAEKLDGRADLYAIGVILFELLTGQLPFDGPSPVDIIYKHMHEDPPRPSAVRADVDARLEEICLKALRKDPAERFASAREMRGALRAALGTAHDGGPPASRESPEEPPSTREPPAYVRATPRDSLDDKAEPPVGEAPVAAPRSARWPAAAAGGAAVILVGVGLALFHHSAPVTPIGPPVEALQPPPPPVLEAPPAPDPQAAAEDSAAAAAPAPSSSKAPPSSTHARSPGARTGTAPAHSASAKPPAQTPGVDLLKANP